MNIFRSIFIIAAFFSCAYTILPYSIYASPASQESSRTSRQILRISPFQFNVKLSPNKISEHTITVENLTNAPLPLVIERDGFSLSDTDLSNIEWGAEDDRSISSWISIDESDHILAPLESRIVRFRMTTPETIPLGGYYGMLVVRPLASPLAQNTSSLLETSIMIPILANIGTGLWDTYRATITEFYIPFIITNPQEESYVFRVHNRDSFFFQAKPIIEIYPIQGDAYYHFPEERFMFPGKQREWRGSLSHIPESFFSGLYRAQLRVSVGNGNQITASQWFFLIKSHQLPYTVLFGLLSVTIISIAGFLLIKAIKNTSPRSKSNKSINPFKSH